MSEIKIGDFASTHTWVIRSGCLVRTWVADIIALDIFYPCHLQDVHLFKPWIFAIRDIFIHLFKNYYTTLMMDVKLLAYDVIRIKRTDYKYNCTVPQCEVLP